MNRLAVNVLAAFALCALAVTLAMLLVPSIAWADMFEYLTTQPPCKGLSVYRYFVEVGETADPLLVRT
jgi:hypothetical protein